MCAFLAMFNFYYSIGYQNIVKSHLNIEITSQINTQEDINILREMAHYFHNSYIETLKDQSDLFSNFGKILIAIAVLCMLLIIAIYKSKFLTSSSNGRKKHAA